MSILDKAKVAIGLNHKSRLDLTHAHITTSNFMDMQPVTYRHMIPQEKYTCNVHAFARLASLTVPTYGRARLNLRAFFVPFRTVMPKFNDFITDTVSASYGTNNSARVGIVQQTPYFTNDDLVRTFNNGAVVVGGQSYPLTTVGTATSYDFQFTANTYDKLTPMGRRFWKILRSLGYHLIPSDKDTTPFSALALLAYLRVYFDWYSVSAYMDTASYQLFQSWFTYDNPSTPLRLNDTELLKIAAFLMKVSYDGDYFTAAWDNPVAPNSSLFSPFVFPDFTFDPLNASSASPNQLVTNYNTAGNGTPSAQSVIAAGGGQQVAVLTQYADDALHALTDYMKRHQLSGARTIDRYLADFGINLPADKLQRSTYLGMSSMDVQIGDVMSQANTSSDPNVSNLGDYSGKGYINGGKTFEFQASEFGLFLVVSSILPTGGYVQGYDRNNLHLTKDQFFLPDFDNLGVQAIAKGELYVSKNSAFASQSGAYDGVFGYTPRYAEYKVARDQVTGDFSTSAMAGGDSWHLMRLFDDAYFNGTVANVQHDLDFCLGTDSDQYSRIFNNTENDLDKFYLVYQFDDSAYAPCNSLFDTYHFECESKRITMDSNGVKMN